LSRSSAPAAMTEHCASRTVRRRSFAMPCGLGGRTRTICCGRFRPHSKERFVRRAEDLAVQRLFAFRPLRRMRDLTAGPRCGSTSWRCVGTSNASR
jgi:hypothetical protein